MIVRVFRARVRPGRIEAFERMVREQSIPWLERSEGLLGYFPGRPMDDTSREFVMVTLWRDQACLERFTGSDWRTPVVTEEEAPLVEDMTAHHYRHFGPQGFE